MDALEAAKPPKNHCPSPSRFFVDDLGKAEGNIYFPIGAQEQEGIFGFFGEWGKDFADGRGVGGDVCFWEGYSQSAG